MIHFIKWVFGFLFIVFSVMLFAANANAAQCTLTSTASTQLNAFLAPYEAKLKGLATSEAKGRIEAILPKLQTLKSLAKYMDTTSFCMIDTVNERLSALGNEISNLVGTSSGSRIGTDCPTVGPEVKIIAAEGGEDDFGARPQYLFYAPGMWHRAGVKAKQVNAYEFISPKDYTSGPFGITGPQQGSWTNNFDITISQCPGDFRESIPKECRFEKTRYDMSYFMSSDGKMPFVAGKTRTVCNIGYNKRWYLNVRPIAGGNFNPDIIHPNPNYNYAGFILYGSMTAKRYLEPGLCKGEVPKNAIITGKSGPDSYPENDTWRYDQSDSRLACTWSCGHSSLREGNGCKTVDFSGTYSSPVFVKKEKMDVDDMGNAGKTWFNGQRGARGEYAGGAVVNMGIDGFKNYTLPATKVTLPSGKCQDNFMFYKLSNPTNCRVHIESWRCTFDTETWRVPCDGQTDPVHRPQDL